MPTEHSEEEGIKYRTPYIGQVLDNADPLKVMRVRVNIPGIFEGDSPWVLPITGPGGGSNHRGTYRAPKRGAFVVVVFIGGDPEKPHYLPSNWGIPNNILETPGSAAANALSPEDRTRVVSSETDDWLLEIDERAGHRKLTLTEKRPDEPMHLEFDGEQRSLRVYAPVAVAIETKGVFDVRALAITLNGRVVLPSSEPI